MGEASSSDLQQQVVAGIGWSAISKGVVQLLELAAMVILARLLLPRAFGLLEMVLVFSKFAQIFLNLGFREALIQKEDLQPIHCDSIFWANLATGLVMSAGFIGGAPLLSAFYGEPVIEPVTMAIGVAFLIQAFGIVPSARLRRAMNFRSLAVVSVSSTGLAAALAVGLAMSGAGVWSLVAQVVVSAAVETTTLWLLGNWTPRLTFSKAAVRDLLVFGSNLAGFRVLNYWYRNSDNLLIGRVIGGAALGLYSKAYGLMVLPMRLVSSTVSQVMFPALSSIQNDTDRVARGYLKSVRVVALITFPMMLGLLAVAEPFVIGLFGENWRDMIPLLRVFCISGLVQSIAVLNGNLYLSQGRSDLHFRVGGAIAVVGVGAIVLGLQWGTMGVAVAYVTYTVLSSILDVHIAARLVDLSVGTVMREVGSTFGCAAVMAGLVAGFGTLLPPSWNAVARLSAQIACGVGTYGGMVVLFRLQAYQNFRETMAEHGLSVFGVSG